MSLSRGRKNGKRVFRWSRNKWLIDLMTGDDPKEDKWLEDWFIVIGIIGVLLIIIFLFIKFF